VKDLQGHRDYAYRYLDLDETDVDVSLIDTWIAEGYRRIIQVIKRWPFFQTIETLNTVNGQRAYPLPGELVDVRSIEAPWGVLNYLDYSEPGTSSTWTRVSCRRARRGHSVSGRASCTSGLSRPLRRP
jgi:hypothetical protein